MPETLARGSTGDLVRALQVRLNARRFARLRADGVFGPMTEAAVREARRRLGLPHGGVDEALSAALTPKEGVT